MVYSPLLRRSVVHSDPFPMRYSQKLHHIKQHAKPTTITISAYKTEFALTMVVCLTCFKLASINLLRIHL